MRLAWVNICKALGIVGIEQELAIMPFHIYYLKKIFFINLFLFFWLCWVFLAGSVVAVHRLL